MPADSQLIAQAVVNTFASAFAAGRISQAVTVSRRNVTRPNITDLVAFEAANPVAGVIRVFVMADDEDLDEEDTTREDLIVDYPIIVGIAAKPKEVDGLADVDALHQLRQELKDYFFKQDAGYELVGSTANAISIQTVTDCDKKTLREKGLFLAEFIVTFKGDRSRWTS